MFFSSFRQQTDEELMRRIQAGEGKALTELYTRYSRAMLRYFFRMLWKDEDKAQDFLHDLFLRLIENPGIFDPKRKFSTWLYSVAHNMCKNEYRKQAFRESAHNGMQQTGFAESQVDERIDQRAFSRIVDEQMRKWSEDERTLFVLRHELELGFSEIGDILSIPEGTAKSRWFYLRKSLALRFPEFQTVLR